MVFLRVEVKTFSLEKKNALSTLAMSEMNYRSNKLSGGEGEERLFPSLKPKKQNNLRTISTNVPYH